MDWEKEINKIFDNAYSRVSVCPKHTIFQRQKALTEIVSLIRQHIPKETLIRKDERERIIKWGAEICPHWSEGSTREVGVIKHDCSQYWQALKEKNPDMEVE